MTVRDGFDFLDRRHRLEPGALQAHLVAHEPLHEVRSHEPPFYVVSRYDDVTALLRDNATWSSARGSGVDHSPGTVLATSDKPDHTAHRRVVAPAFTPAAMAALEPRVAALADELFDAFVPLGEGDLVSLYAGPLPAIVIAEMLGVPAADRARFRHWADELVIGLGGEDLDRAVQAREELGAYLLAALDERLVACRAGRDAGDDLLARIARAHLEGTLTRAQMVAISIQLLVAGHETTTSLLGLVVYRLVQHPEVFARVQADRSLIAPLVEETLRFDSPVQGLFRTPTCPVHLHDTELAPDTKVQALYAGANRDPAVFTRPDEFDIDRPRAEQSRHVAFGHGIHFCVGAPLARLEARLSLERLFDRMEAIELTAEPTVIRPFILRGFSSLPIRWRVRA